MCRIAASKLISGTVSARALASPGEMARPSTPGARFSGKRPLPHDRQRKYVLSTSTRQNRVRNDFLVAGCRRIGLPQPSYSGVGSMPSSCSRSSFSAAAKRAVAERPLHFVRIGKARREARTPPETASRSAGSGSSSVTSRHRTSPPSIQCRVVRPRTAGPPLRPLRPNLPDTSQRPDADARDFPCPAP